MHFLQYEKGQIQVFFHTLVWGPLLCPLLWLPQETIKLLPCSVHSRLTINIFKALDQSNFKAHVGENFPKERTGDTKSSLYSDKSRQYGADNLVPPSHTTGCTINKALSVALLAHSWGVIYCQPGDNEGVIHHHRVYRCDHRHMVWWSYNYTFYTKLYRKYHEFVAISIVMSVQHE